MNKPLAYENHLDVQEPRWFAVYTKYKREKLVHRHLKEKGIQAYIPLQKFVRRYERKVREVELPLISCYVFARIIKKEYVPVLETQDVLQFVKFSGNLISIPDREIEWLKRIVGEGMDVEVENSNYQKGDRVEIVSGNLTGIQGILLDCNRKNFLVELKDIGYSLRMQVNPALLRKVKGE